MKNIFREITPLAKNDLFWIRYHENHRMTFPLHFHEDFELTLMQHVHGKRIIGSLVEDFGKKDLILVGSNLLHCWKRAPDYVEVPCESIVLQFHKSVPESGIFSTDQLRPIKELLERSKYGIQFSSATVDSITPKLYDLVRAKGFDSVVLFLDIFNDLAHSPDQRVLSPSTMDQERESSIRSSYRVNKIMHYVEQNYKRRITLEDIGQIVGMSASSVSRYFKKRTGHRFWDYLNNFRIDQVTRQMMESNQPISSICYACGFNNLSNFNRVFKERTGETPRQYRERLKNSIVPMGLE